MELALGIIAGAVVVMAVTFIACYRLLWNTTKGIRGSLRLVESKMLPLLAQCESAVAAVQRVAERAQHGIARVNGLLESVGELRHTVRGAQEAVRRHGTNVLANVLLLQDVARSATSFFRRATTRSGSNGQHND